MLRRVVGKGGRSSILVGNTFLFILVSFKVIINVLNWGRRVRKQL